MIGNKKVKPGIIIIINVLFNLMNSNVYVFRDKITFYIYAHFDIEHDNDNNNKTNNNNETTSIK